MLSEVPMGKLSCFLFGVFGTCLCLAVLWGSYEYKLLREAQLHAPTRSIRTMGQFPARDEAMPVRRYA